MLLLLPHLSNELRLDVVVEQELREDDKLLAQEEEGEVDCGVHHAVAVHADGGGDVADAHGVEVLPVGRRAALDKDLLVEVVAEGRDEDVYVAHDLQDVESLLHGLAGKAGRGRQLRLHELKRRVRRQRVPAGRSKRGWEEETSGGRGGEK